DQLGRKPSKRQKEMLHASLSLVQDYNFHPDVITGLSNVDITDRRKKMIEEIKKLSALPDIESLKVICASYERGNSNGPKSALDELRRLGLLHSPASLVFSAPSVASSFSLTVTTT